VVAGEAESTNNINGFSHSIISDVKHSMALAAISPTIPDMVDKAHISCHRPLPHILISPRIVRSMHHHSSSQCTKSQSPLSACEIFISIIHIFQNYPQILPGDKMKPSLPLLIAALAAAGSAAPTPSSQTISNSLSAVETRGDQPKFDFKMDFDSKRGMLIPFRRTQ
jgi:hypothetical protein